MRLSRVQVVNFCCLQDLTVSFDDVTVLVGANGTGKSTVLYALAWFFEGGPLTEEHISGHQLEEQVTVGATFTDFDASDRDALGSYVVGEEATFWRTWSSQDGEKLTGKGRAYPDFAAIRQQDAAMAKRSAYNALREARQELGLPKAASARAVDDALAAWEAEHPDELEDGRTDATHLFGFTGQARLAQRMDFVLIRALVDPDQQTTDGRGTLLRQLLDRALGEQSTMRERLVALEEEVSGQMAAIMRAEGGAALSQLSRDVTDKLVQLVPGGEVLLDARPPTVRAPSLSVDVKIADEGFTTAVARQGHGFQRALLIAVVQQLAAVTAADGVVEGGATGPSESPPALMLAIEEPELYQHPLQARHFAATLAALASQPGAPIQICYATHSEYFIDPSHYERLRRFSRRRGAAWPSSRVTQATVERVTRRLSDVYDAEQIPLRVRMTLRRQVAESIFAKAVVLVEGESDVGLLQGLADRRGGFDAMGIAVVRGHGKRQLLIPWAILVELGVPVYVVFDGDAAAHDRMLAAGKSKTDADAERRRVADENSLVLRTLGAQAAAQPETSVGDGFAVFVDTLESELATWSGFEDAVGQFRQEQGDFRSKPDDAYRHAAGAVPSDPPEVLAHLLDRVFALGA